MPRLASRYGVRDLPTKNYATIPEVMALPDLIEIQLRSFEQLKEEGIRELLLEISPIESFKGNLQLYFLDYWFEEPKYSEEDCQELDLTFAAPMWMKTRLINKETGEMQEQDVFMGEFPLMTSKGTFIHNGSERVVVSQLIRSPNAYFSLDEDRTTGRRLASGKLIPDRGTWMEFSTNKRDVISIKVDRKRKMPFTTFLRALGAVPDGFGSTLLQTGSDEELHGLFDHLDTDPDHKFLDATIERDPVKTAEEAVLEFYRKMRPGDPVTLDNATNFLQSLLFDPRRYDLEQVGRYKLNKTLKVERDPAEPPHGDQEDIVKMIARVILINNGVGAKDDIDHLGNRRVKTVGELVAKELRVGLLRIERVVRERMSIRDPEKVTPHRADQHPADRGGACASFFGGSQLSQFMDQTNPLSELRHKRTLSALGPGRPEPRARRLRRARRAPLALRPHLPDRDAGRAEHRSDRSPRHLRTVNEFGFIETPYRKVLQRADNDGVAAVGEFSRDEVLDPETGDPIIGEGEQITKEIAQRWQALDRLEIRVRTRVSDEIVYLSADDEEQYTIAQANTPTDEEGYFTRDRVSCGAGRTSSAATRTKVDYRTSRPSRSWASRAALIPFLEHDDANRALMGSNMQRQAVPLRAAGGTDRLDRHGIAGRARLRPGGAVAPRGAGGVGDLRARHRSRPRR